MIRSFGLPLVILIVMITFQTFQMCHGASMIRILIKRDAYHSFNSYNSNKLEQNKPCDSGVIIRRSCTYEECLKYRYPNVGICRRWDEIEWSEKVLHCPIVVNSPCNGL